MADFNWQCPHCEHAVTISDGRVSSDSHVLMLDSADGKMRLYTQYIVCPNPKCKRVTLSVALFKMVWQGNQYKDADEIKRWQLIPNGSAKVFPDYIPEVIRNDYLEACQIVDLSPKASATLSRRCLQGILRDYWKVTPGNLWQEIQQIEDKTDETTWNAIDAVREIGNIGAHMQKDINVIVDVDPGEAEMLIQLVETLLTEWYVGRYQRNERMKAITAAAAAKKVPPK